MRRSMTLILCGSVAAGYWLALPARAGDVDVILDSTNGSSSFIVSNSASNALATVKSSGRVGINTNAPQAALHVAGDAVIGSLANAPRFGMQAVATSTSGILFTHPATNLCLIWDASAFALTVSNGVAATVSFDAHVLMSRDADSGTNRMALGYARDLYGPETTLVVSNTANQSAGFTVTVVQEGSRIPGFTFQGACWHSSISGLVTFWY